MKNLSQSIYTSGFNEDMTGTAIPVTVTKAGETRVDTLRHSQEGLLLQKSGESILASSLEQLSDLNKVFCDIRVANANLTLELRA